MDGIRFANTAESSLRAIGNVLARAACRQIDRNVAENRRAQIADAAAARRVMARSDTSLLRQLQTVADKLTEKLTENERLQRELSEMRRQVRTAEAQAQAERARAEAAEMKTTAVAQHSLNLIHDLELRVAVAEHVASH